VTKPGTAPGTVSNTGAGHAYAPSMVEAHHFKTNPGLLRNCHGLLAQNSDSRIPNKCLAPADSLTQHNSMTTKKYICILAGATLLVIFQVFGCKSSWTPGKVTEGPTPTPTPSSKAQPGKVTERHTPAPY
jgi:hypothetical protein